MEKEHASVSAKILIGFALFNPLSYTTSVGGNPAHIVTYSQTNSITVLMLT